MKKAYIVFITFLFPFICLSKETDLSKKELINKILNSSGALQQVESIPAVVQTLIPIQLAAWGLINSFINKFRF